MRRDVPHGEERGRATREQRAALGSQAGRQPAAVAEQRSSSWWALPRFEHMRDDHLDTPQLPEAVMGKAIDNVCGAYLAPQAGHTAA